MAQSAPDQEIRTAREGDLPALVHIYNHYVANTHVTFDTEVFTPESRREWFDAFTESGPYRLFVAEVGGQLVGFASSSRFHRKAGYDRSVETTIYIDPAFVGRGLGNNLYTHLLESIHSDAVVHRAFGGIALPNASSVALHEQLGFKLAGTFHEVGFKFGKYWNVGWYEKKLPGGHIV